MRTRVEYFFKRFYSRGDDEYLRAWAAEIDLMADQEWKVLDCHRQASPGFWITILGRPAHEFRDEGAHWTEESELTEW